MAGLSAPSLRNPRRVGRGRRRVTSSVRALCARLEASTGMQRGTEEIGVFSGVWTDFLTAGGQNKVYAPLTGKWAKAEGELFPGITVVVLAAGRPCAEAQNAQEPAGSGRSSARRLRLARVFDVLLLTGLAVWVASRSGVQSARPPQGARARQGRRIASRFLPSSGSPPAFPQPLSFFRPRRLPPRDTDRDAEQALFLAIAVARRRGRPRHPHPLLPVPRPVLRTGLPTRSARRRAVSSSSTWLSAVLAAWGLSDWTRSRGARGAARPVARRSRWLRSASSTAPFLSRSPAWTHEPAPVYRWLAASVVLRAASSNGRSGNWYDQEYEFRSTAHWKPLVNGASGFAPRDYDELAATLDRKPIPDEAWSLLARRRTSLLVYHPEAVNPETSRGVRRTPWTVGSGAAGSELARVLSRGRLARFCLPARVGARRRNAGHP